MKKPRRITIRDACGDRIKAILCRGYNTTVGISVDCFVNLIPKQAHRLAKRIEEMACWLEENEK